MTKGFSDRNRSVNVGIANHLEGAVDWAEPRRSGLARVIPAVLGSRVVRRVDRPVFGKMVWGREIDIDQQGRAVTGMVCLTTNLHETKRQRNAVGCWHSRSGTLG
jgi:hypothetical protein